MSCPVLRAQPHEDRGRIQLEHSRYCPNAQAFSQSGDYGYDPLSRERLTVKERTVRFEAIRVTDHAVDLSPSSTTRMAVGANITVPDPAVIGARFRGTVLGLGVDCSRTSSLAGDQGRRGQRGLVKVLLILLTGCTVGLLG